MHIKKAGGKVYGAILTAAEKKAMDIEIQKELAEYDRKHIAEIDATILWVLHEQFGFGAQRLRTYYNAFHDRIKELVSRYEMEDQDDIWLCTQMLKRIGVDIEAWHKESDHGDLMLLEEWCGTFAWFEQCCSMIWRRILIFHRSSCPLSNAGENLSQIGSSPNCKKNTASAICMPNRLSNS